MDSAEITQEILSQWIDEQRLLTLIDIREEEERKKAHIGGEWIPLSQLWERLDEIPQHPVVLYCYSGGRSLVATYKLREILLRDTIYSLAGGIRAHS